MLNQLLLFGDDFLQTLATVPRKRHLGQDSFCSLRLLAFQIQQILVGGNIPSFVCFKCFPKTTLMFVEDAQVVDDVGAELYGNQQFALFSFRYGCAHILVVLCSHFRRIISPDFRAVRRELLAFLPL
jgi:hypothetical protein